MLLSNRHSFRCSYLCPFSADSRSYSNNQLRYYTPCSASLKRLFWPSISFDFSLDTPKSFLVNLLLHPSHGFAVGIQYFAQGFYQIVLAFDGSVQLADCILVLHKSGVLDIPFHVFFPLLEQMKIG